MNSKYEPLFQSFTFSWSRMTIRNRLLMAPMTTWSGNLDGTVSDAEIAHYQKRSQGIGAVLTAAAYVMPQGQGFAGQIGAHSEEMIPSLKRMATTIQAQGAKALLQIHHGGRMSPPEILPDKQPVSASAVAALHGGSTTPRELKEEEILQIIQAFGQATRRAIEAGFDGVEIHGANTYLLQQFFSPHANRRNDKWGGSLGKRMTFPLAVTDEVINTVIKHAKRPFMVGYRLSPEEIENPGITMEDTLQLVDTLATKQLDYLHISTMNFWGGSLRDDQDKRPRVVLIHERVGKQIPIIGVGSIHTPDEALQAFQTGIPLLALGRELLMEPDWVQKVQNGQEDQIRTTLSKAAQQELVLPDGLWQVLMASKGWLPVV
jgi:2,4-dienoyl-CoA reductase-like NADH-dependent reductase (Old Yellow Enzyme family)